MRDEWQAAIRIVDAKPLPATLADCAVFSRRFEAFTDSTVFPPFRDGPEFDLQTIDFKWFIEFHVTVTEYGIRTLVAIGEI